MNRNDWLRMDDLDRSIVEKLASDARVSNRGLAAELGVTDGTIRTRIKRLQNKRLIQFSVVTDFRMAGSPSLCMIGIDADPGQVADLSKKLSDLSEICCVIVLLGRYSLLAMTLMPSMEALNDLIVERIRPLKGVRSVETSISIHNLKYEPGMAKITSPEN